MENLGKYMIFFFNVGVGGSNYFFENRKNENVSRFRKIFFSNIGAHFVHDFSPHFPLFLRLTTKNAVKHTKAA